MGAEMQVTRFILCVALVASPSAAVAAPVYLQCEYSYKAQSHDIAVALNEEMGTATMVENGQMKRVPAVFSPQQVVIVMGGLDPRYTIDRVNLGFVADWQAYFGPVSAQGKCSITPDPARKF
jgi:hypothetical protein